MLFLIEKIIHKSRISINVFNLIDVFFVYLYQRVKFNLITFLRLRRPTSVRVSHGKTLDNTVAYRLLQNQQHFKCVADTTPDSPQELWSSFPPQ